MSKTLPEDLNDLSHGEIDKIIHSDHVTAEQLNLLAAHTQHINAEREAELRELTERMARIKARIDALKDS